jgi:hypothetical protein
LQLCFQRRLELDWMKSSASSKVHLEKQDKKGIHEFLISFISSLIRRSSLRDELNPATQHIFPILLHEMFIDTYNFWQAGRIRMWSTTFEQAPNPNVLASTTRDLSNGPQFGTIGLVRG